MRIVKKRLFTVIIVLGCCFQAILSSEAGAASIHRVKRGKLTDAERILSPFKAGAEIHEVIVHLAEDESLRQKKQWRSSTWRKQFRGRVRTRQEDFLKTLGDRTFLIRYQFRNQATFSAHVSLETLEVLSEHPMVEFIEPVVAFEPHLEQGISLMNAEDARMTFSGQGVSIAICDTGIDYTHPALGGGGFPNSKVIGGFDIADWDDDPMPESLAHGTSCAGIAAGDVIYTGDYIGGVAYNAKLYALKITAGSSSTASDSSIAKAWDWCVTHQNDDPNNPIMVISTSFGGGQYNGNCDGSSWVLRIAAENAVDAGITILASSGNNGYCDSISKPACLGDIISVGAVYDAYIGNLGFCLDDGSCVSESGTFDCGSDEFPIWQTTGADVVASYSNTASILDILAPSHDAYTLDIVGSSGGSTGDYNTEFGGTSAACPYAAGAVACIQSAAMSSTGSFLTPAEVKELLTSTGDDITDDKIEITKPRVNVGNAVATFPISAPTAESQEIAFEVNTPKTITLIAYDEGLPNPPGGLDYIITSLPNHGTLTDPSASTITTVPYTLLNDGNQVVYTSKPGCDVSAWFTFKANDGGLSPEGGDSNEAIVNLPGAAAAAGDFEPDCDVDADDLAHLIAYWQQTCGECDGADLLADGIVNLEDFLILAENWLTE